MKIGTKCNVLTMLSDIKLLNVLDKSLSGPSIVSFVYMLNNAEDIENLCRVHTVMYAVGQISRN